MILAVVAAVPLARPDDHLLQPSFIALIAGLATLDAPAGASNGSCRACRAGRRVILGTFRRRPGQARPRRSTSGRANLVEAE